MGDLLSAARHELSRYKSQADRAVSALSDDDLFRKPGEAVNPVALVVKHVGGNLRSRWTDFLTTDGDKPDRDRDAEFVTEAADTRASLLAGWDDGFAAALATLDALTADDLTRVVTIRGEPHTVLQAVVRTLTHTAYHVGQVLYVARLLRPDAPWLTVAPGESKSHAAGYLKPA